MIKVNFNTYASYVTDSLYQWDLNQVLSVSGLNLAVAPEVHFSNANMDKAIVKQATLKNHIVTVKIPNSLLQDSLTINAHIGIYDGDTFKVVEKVEIPVIARKRPSDYRIENSDEEIYSFEALKNLLDNKADTNVINARVDNIVAHNNDTESNTELIDIRVGANGKTYSSAGEAVRKQFKNLPIAKNAHYITRGSFYIDSAVGIITATEKYTGGGVIYTNDTFVWLKDFDSKELNYLSIAREHGSDASWAYVVDTENKTFAFRRMGAPESDNQRVRSTDIIIFFGLCSASGKFSTFVPLTNEIYLDGVLQRNTLNAVWPWNRIIGSMGAKIEIDTATKKLTMKGIFFLESGMWKNLDVSIDLTSYAPSADGETVRIILNKNNELEIDNLETKCNLDDIFICSIFTSGSWAFDASRIYTNNATKALIYVNGEAILPDAKTICTDVNAIENRVNVLQKNIGVGKTTCKIFKKVVCCGDSYTSGHMTDPDGVARGENEAFAWPHYMATTTGNEWINCGQSGANVLTWQTSGRGLSKAQASGKAQAYIIGLMLNDMATGTDRYVELGTIDDIGTDANTYYGGMSAIIRKLNEISPKAKIFIQTTPVSGGLFTEYNQAVRDIVAAYKNIYPVHCLDLYEYKDMYSVDSVIGDSLDGHYTAIGYEQFAEILSVIISDYINNNIADFQDVPFIEYDE